MTVTARCRRLKVAWLIAFVAMSVVGCSGSGSNLALNPRRIALREQLSRLEFQNQQLKDELKVAQQETKRLNNDLQLAEIDNRDLEGRVDSFRTQLGLNSRGGGADDSYGSARNSPNGGNAGFGSGSTRPAAQPQTRAPFTRIPNPSAIDVTPPSGPSAEDFYGIRRSPSYEKTPRPRIEPPPIQYFDVSPSSARAEVSDQSRALSGSAWTPLARGSSRSIRSYE